MAPVPARTPAPSGAALSLIGVAIAELRRDVDRLVVSRWNETMRRRAAELSSTLAEACERQGLLELQIRLHAVANLTRLDRVRALPLLPSLQEKFAELLRDVDARLPRRPRG